MTQNVNIYVYVPSEKLTCKGLMKMICAAQTLYDRSLFLSRFIVTVNGAIILKGAIHGTL